MNATRAATIRGRAWVGGVVSLGRVQTPTLALIVKREREIQAFVPEPYWLVHGTFEAPSRAGYPGLWFEADETRLRDGKRAAEIAEKVGGKEGRVASVERKEQTERPPLLYDLTSLQREANRRFGFSARRTLSAAQSLYEDKKAITYPRTSSRFLSGDLVPQLKPTAETLLPIAEYAPHARFVMGLAELPLGRVVNDARVDDHHAIIPTDVEHDVDRFSPDERRIFDLIARRFLAVFHPAARFQRTEVEQAHAPIGAGDAELAVAVFDVGGRRFQLRGRRVLPLAHHFVRGCLCRDAADGEEARAAGEAVARHDVGVALHDANLRGVDTQLRR